MTIKVIGAGFGRTGTLSLKHALERLGFEKAHHMLEVAKSREQIDHWTAIAKGDPVDWDRVFDGFQSTTDFPACVYYKELCTTYPDAKVILSVRDEDRWHTSVINTILPVSKSVPSWLLFLLRPQKRLLEAINTIVWQNTFHGKASDPDYAKQIFREHNQAVIKQVPADRLLVFEAQDGWEPLCRFLEVPIPEEEYPHLNDTAQMQKSIRLLKILRWLPLIVLGLVTLIITIN